VELRSCVDVELWSCGVVELWSCGVVELWSCLVVKLRLKLTDRGSHVGGDALVASGQSY
jgi:hypothetical protein